MSRTEHDALGSYILQDTQYEGIHTQRSRENFPISTIWTQGLILRQLIVVKKAAAISNYKVNLLTKNLYEHIVIACDTLIRVLDTAMSTANAETTTLNNKDLALLNSMKLSPMQGGAGTSTNMNVNELIANLALESMGHPLGAYDYCHPINHVNLSQSTNDVYPTAVRMAAIYGIRNLADHLAALQEALQEKEHAFASVLKLGRTQLMDALPITMGQEFGAFARAISRDRWRIYKVEERLREVNIGGTAVGTGMNAPTMYIYRITEELQRLTGLGIARSDLLIDSTQNQDVFVEVIGLLKALATNLLKISNDIRLMGSGPIGGFGELNIPAVQAGSSIMPGKVNPVICEMINQIAFRVIGADTTITYAASSGQLELNPYLPMIAHELLTVIEQLNAGIPIFIQKVIEPLTANEKHCKEMALSSYGLAAAFVDTLGYDLSADVAKEAKANGQSIKTVLLQRNLLDESEIDAILSIHQLTQPGIPGKR